MRTHRRSVTGVFLLGIALVPIVLVCAVPWAAAQSPDAGAVKPLLVYPLQVPEEAYWKSVGFTAVAPPPEITEALQIRWPALDYHALYGLPYGFSLDGRLASQVLQNRIAVGPRWASTVGPVAFSVGYDFAYWFGVLKVSGFDSKGHGWQGGANFSLGYKLGEVAMTAKAELLADFSATTYQGDSEVSQNSKAMSGAAFTFAMEQPFYKDQVLSLGFRAIYTKFYWQTWSLYSTFDRYLFFPEIFVGWIL
jgi:hypothetical protein